MKQGEQLTFFPQAPPSKGGAGETQAVRIATVRQLVTAHHAMLEDIPEKTSLMDIGAVKKTVSRYLEMCGDAGVLPTFTGLSGALGLSRRALYKHLDDHPNDEVSQYLERLRGSWAALRVAAVDRNCAAETLTIFLLKNSSLDFRDRFEVVPEIPTSPLDNLDSSEARKRLTEAIPDDD